MQPAIVFDLDGTLIDSAPDIAAALNRTLKLYNLPALPVDQVAVMVGDGAAVLLARAFAAHGKAPGAAQLAQATASYLADYQANLAVETRAYDGVPEALESLARAGWAMAVCTNKPQAAARAILDRLGLGGHFPVVGGGDSFPVRKPDPRHLAETLRAAGMDRAVMVGDHANDMLAAGGCGLPSIWAGWGYTAENPGAVWSARDPRDLPGLAGQAWRQVAGSRAAGAGAGRVSSGG